MKSSIIFAIFALAATAALPPASDAAESGEKKRNNAETGSLTGEDIDWNRAQTLNQRHRKGDTLTAEEKAYLDRALAIRQKRGDAPSRDRTGSAGDGSAEERTVKPALVPEEDSPVRRLTATASDGREISVAYRVPKGDAPFPAIVFFHGGMSQSAVENLEQSARTNPTHTRFLDAGYVAVSASYRSYANEPRSRGPILDATAIVRAVKELPEVDPASVAVFGGSGGGSIVLELASEDDASPVAVIAGEPATVIYTGMLPSYSERDSVIRSPQEFYTDEIRERTEAKIAAIDCPILIHHGDQHLLKIINFEIVFPAIESAGKTLVVKKYPGQPHGFYWGNKTDLETLERLIANTREFLEPLLKTKPGS